MLSKSRDHESRRGKARDPLTFNASGRQKSVVPDREPPSSLWLGASLLQSLAVALSIMQVTVKFGLCVWFHFNSDGNHPKENGQWATPFSTNLRRTLSAEWLFRVSPCRKGTIHLQTFISFQGLEPRPYGTAVSDTNHYIGWADTYDISSYSYIVKNLKSIAHGNLYKTLKEKLIFELIHWPILVPTHHVNYLCHD
ncbi:hypothetical protein TNCV_223031 [Trichonephila clavipes]|nr:hypothetical protein TNCV_223031 [Trichonephila clavipes]